MVIILGDFNAKIGIYQPLWKDTMDKFGIGNINKCGERLLQFCIVNELFVANTVFPHKSLRKWTWNHPNRVHKSMIDYIIVRKDGAAQCLVPEASLQQTVDQTATL